MQIIVLVSRGPDIYLMYGSLEVQDSLHGRILIAPCAPVTNRCDPTRHVSLWVQVERFRLVLACEVAGGNIGYLVRHLKRTLIRMSIPVGVLIDVGLQGIALAVAPSC